MIKGILIKEHDKYLRLIYFQIGCNLTSNLINEELQWCSYETFNFVRISSFTFNALIKSKLGKKDN